MDGRIAVGAAIVIAGVVGAAFIVRDAFARESERIRAVKVTLDARDAAERGARPSGALTIVTSSASRENPSRPVYLFTRNTEYPSREGQSLDATLTDDNDRVTRHAEVLRSKKPLVTRFADGFVRVTVPASERSAELLANPLHIEGPSVYRRTLGALVFGLFLFVFGGERLRPVKSFPLAAIGGVAIIALAAPGWLGSLEATMNAFIAEGRAHRPLVSHEASYLYWALGGWALIMASLACLTGSEWARNVVRTKLGPLLPGARSW